LSTFQRVRTLYIFLRQESPYGDFYSIADGYGGPNQSDIALRWLKSVEEDLGRPLVTAAHGLGEKVGEERERERDNVYLQRLRVDGHNYSLDGYDPETDTAYEFNGCM